MMKRSLQFENIVLLMLVAALPVVFASGFTAYEVLKSGVLILGGSILFLAWALHALRGAEFRLQGGLVLLPMIGLGLLSLISALWSPNAWLALLDGSRWFALLAVMLVLLDPFGKPLKISDFILALSLGTGLAAIVGLLQSQGIILDPLAPGSDSDGLRGSFDHARYAAMTLAPCVPLLASGIFAVKGARRAVPGVALVLVALYVGATEQPHAWWAAGAGIGLAAVALVLVRGARALIPVRGTLIALACAAGFVVVGAMALPPSNKIIVQVNGEVVESDTNARMLMSKRRGLFSPDWGRATPPTGENGRRFARSTALRTIEGKPLFGIGAGNWSASQVRYIDRTAPWYQGSRLAWPSFHSAHNSYLLLASELGLVGAGLLLLFLVMALAVTLRGSKTDEDDGYDGDAISILHRFGLHATVASCLVASVFESVMHQAFGGLVLFSCLGLLLREALRPMKRHGLASVWSLQLGTGGMERYILAGLLPLVIAISGMYFAGTAVISDYYKARGDVWLRAGSFDDAETSYQSALRYAPHNSLALYNLAQVLARRTNLHEREELYLTLVKLRPSDPRIFRELGVLQVREAIRSEQKKKQTPIRVKKNKDGTFDEPEIDPNEMFTIVDEEIIREAMNNLTHAKDLHPRYQAIYEDLYNAYIMNQDFPRAQAVLNEGLGFMEAEDSIQASRFHDLLARSYMNNQEWKPAAKHFKLAMEVDPQSPRTVAIIRDIQIVEAKLSGRPVPSSHGGHGDEHGGKAGGQPVDMKKIEEMLRKKGVRLPKSMKPPGLQPPPVDR